MGLNRDKYRKIVGGITTSEPAEEPESKTPEAKAESSELEEVQPQAGQGGASVDSPLPATKEEMEEKPRFAKRGRPKGRKSVDPTDKVRKVKVSLFLSEVIINDLYDWAHEDRIHPGEMFERALKPFHEKEAKRRNSGKG